MTTNVDALVVAYLDRLNHAARDLPPDRRSELLESIGEHISAARAAGAAADEAAVRTLLDRLGEPDDIVAAARDDRVDGQPAATPQLVAVQPGTGRELGAVLMLTVGSMLPVIGWLAGVALLWSSRRWRTREKLLGTLVVPGGPALVLLLLAPLVALRVSAGASACGVEAPAGPGLPGTVYPCDSTGGGVGWGFFLVVALLILAPVVVAVLLLRAARRRAALEEPVLRAVTQQTSPWGGLEVAALLLLAVGAFVVPVVPLLVGLALVCASRQWSTGTKGVAAALVVLPALLLPAFSLFGGAFRLPGQESLFALYAFGPVGGLLGATLLAVTLGRRPVASAH